MASSEYDRSPRHTILLIQVTSSPSTRTYLDFSSKTKALEGLLRLFEEHLKSNSKRPTITYDESDLYKYLDGLGDISCLVFDPASSKYEPHGRDYIKHAIYLHLMEMAGHRAR